MAFKYSFYLSVLFLAFLNASNAELSGFEGHPVARCAHCISHLQFPGVSHPFEHLAGVIPLDVFCSNLTNFATCIETIGCFNPRAPADYLLEGDDGYLLRGIANTLNITDEICTNGTQLREDYLTHSQCFRNVHLNVSQQCLRQSVNAYYQFRDHEMGGKHIWGNQLSCILASYGLGCLGFAIHEECGDHALDIFREIIGRFGFFEMGFCSTETLETIRTRFINSLNLDESRKSFYLQCIV